MLLTIAIPIQLVLSVVVLVPLVAAGDRLFIFPTPSPIVRDLPFPVRDRVALHFSRHAVQPQHHIYLGNLHQDNESIFKACQRKTSFFWQTRENEEKRSRVIF